MTNQSPLRCIRCRRPPTREGYDACIGHVSGATSACCGHGHTDRAYVNYIDRDRVTGEAALDLMLGAADEVHVDGPLFWIPGGAEMPRYRIVPPQERLTFRPFLDIHRKIRR